MSDRARAKCPRCGRPAVRRVSGGAGLIFKGKGFYITDYGKDGKGPRQEKETESSTETAQPKKDEPAPKVEAEKPSKKKKADS
jgi:predicted nucleic acid-binding Zn ribbon protein